MEDGGQNVDLPPEMIDEILLRLPVKPLCRFKCVSKPWRSLISDPDFEANYSKLAIENKDVFLRRRRLLFTLHCPHGSGHYSLDLDRFLNENHNVDGLVAAPTKLDFVGQSMLRIVCYSDHVLFLSCLSGTFSLINPVTKESKTLPLVPIWSQRMWLRDCHYGLGFDHSSNEYKIDCLFPYNISTTDRGILLNGGIHWLMEKIADKSSVILSFLLAEEEVREIALPPNTTPLLQPGTFRNRLCLTSLATCGDGDDPFNEFRVMNEYGVSESWTTMQLSKTYEQLLSHSRFWTKSYDLMVCNQLIGHLVTYNFNEKTC